MEFKQIFLRKEDNFLNYLRGHISFWYPQSQILRKISFVLPESD